MPIERRRSKRFKLDPPTRFRIYLPSRLESVSSFLDARIYDISEDGLRLLTNLVQSEGLHILHPFKVGHHHPPGAGQDVG